MTTPAMEAEALQRAVDNDELVLYYQPKVSMLSGELVGAEALVRWDTPGSAEVVSPSRFLPLAEQSGMLHDITIGLLDQLVAASLVLQPQYPHLALSINVAPNDLATRVISQRIEQYLQRGTLNSTQLQIEITESQAMAGSVAMADDIALLHRLGVDVMMDDFGTGHSSIDRLSQWPFSALKLDQGVVKRMATSNHNLNVVKAAISMARELDMRSVAEGVEDAATFDMLMANGCEEAQGYYIARPMSLPDLLEFIASAPRFAGSQIGRVHQAVYNLMHYRKCLVDAVLLCKRSSEALPPAIGEPDITRSAGASRVGIWYAAAAPQLQHLASWRELEAPLNALYRYGDALMQQLHAALGDADKIAQLDLQLERVDAEFEAVASGLRRLERELLRTL